MKPKNPYREQYIRLTEDMELAHRINRTKQAYLSRQGFNELSKQLERLQSEMDREGFYK